MASDMSLGSSGMSPALNELFMLFFLTGSFAVEGVEAMTVWVGVMREEEEEEEDEVGGRGVDAIGVGGG